MSFCKLGDSSPPVENFASIDPFRGSLALGPVAVYMLLLAILNITRRPFMTTGARDLAALGVALAGLVVVGPIELFMPNTAANRFGPYVWLLMGTFYVLCLTLLVLMSRPRLVIYNMTLDQLRPTLSGLVARLDPQHRWAGDSLAMPALGVQLHIEAFPAMKNLSLVANSADQSYQGWRHFETELDRVLLQAPCRPNPAGFALLTVGLVLAAVVATWLLVEPQLVAQGCREMLRL